MISQGLDASFGALLLQRFGSRIFVGLAVIAGGVLVLWAAVELPPVPTFVTVIVVVVGVTMIGIGLYPVGSFLLGRKNPEFD